MYGAFHVACLILMLATSVLLCYLWKRGIIQNVKKVVLITSIIVIVFEVYKQIVFNFGDGWNGYVWYAFPWQFCSTPMYIGLFAGLTKGRPHKHFVAYLATFAAFAGLAVMLYPSTVFIPTLGICIQTMVCHGSMVVIAIFLYYTGHVKIEKKTLWNALPIFLIAISIATLLNEVIYNTILPEGATFNMFFISRYFDSELPVYSLIHNAIRSSNPSLYPLGVILYIIGFTVVAGLILVIAKGIQNILTADYEAEYAEMDARRRERIAKRQERLQILEEKRKEEFKKEQERKKREREEKREKRADEREEKRDEKRTEKQKELARKRRKKQKARKEKREEKREERREEREERREEQKKEREQIKKIEKRMREIEKKEKEEKKKKEKAKKKAQKERKAAEKELKDFRKQEKKRMKKFIQELKRNGEYDPDFDYSEYFDL